LGQRKGQGEYPDILILDLTPFGLVLAASNFGINLERLGEPGKRRLMNGPIAQIVALALHGNAFLGGTDSRDFIAKNSTAQHCQSIMFTREEKSWFGLGPVKIVECSSPEMWFADLRARSARRIGVRWVSGNESAPDRMLAGFIGGGGTWTIQVQMADGSFEQWVADWGVDERRRKIDGKIWQVRYRRAYVGWESVSAVPLGGAKSALERALVEAQKFSTRLELKPFTGMFEKGLAAMHAQPGSEAYHRDLSPRALPEDVRAVLSAAQHAWVFGGMGSWNDMGFDGADEKEYERVSEELFKAVTRAIPSAVDAAE
jgi:hypothetical protein